MTDSILAFVDNLGISYGFALLMASGCAVGTAACLAWAPEHPDGWMESAARGDRMARMTIGDFVRRVTLQTRQGKLFVLLSAANLALAAALPLLPEKAQASPVAPFLWFWPLFLFILSVMGLLPAWTALVTHLLGIR